MMEKLRWRRAVAVPVALVIGALIALVAAIWLIPSRREDIGFEIAKAAAQAIPYVFLSIGVGLFLRQSEASREDRRLADDHRRRVFGEVATAYNRIKGIRRWLRAAGYLEMKSGSLSAERLAEFDGRMDAFSEAELVLEKVRREVEGHPHVFSHSGDLIGDLSTVTTYLRAVVKNWEDSQLSADDSRERIARWNELQGFLRNKGKKGATFKEGVSTPMDHFVKTLLTDLLPAPRPAE